MHSFAYDSFFGSHGHAPFFFYVILPANFVIPTRLILVRLLEVFMMISPDVANWSFRGAITSRVS